VGCANVDAAYCAYVEVVALLLPVLRRLGLRGPPTAASAEDGGVGPYVRRAAVVLTCSRS